MKPTVSVESPGMNIPRKGRGFSKEELSAAKFSIQEAREAGLLVDIRRKSKYKENVDSLKAYKTEYAKILAEKEKVRLKAQKDNVKARKDAVKRKKEMDIELSKREKEIEEEKKKVQEDIARREAEELEAETEVEELSEDELAELDDLEAETLDDESSEEALEKLEDDLAETLGEADETPAAPEGATRVVKRVRKKPTTTTKGVADKAEKKE